MLPGILGSLQANEVIKVIAGIGDPLVGRLFLIDALSFETRTLKLQKRKDGIKIERLIDYEQFCGLKLDKDLAEVKELSVQEFDTLQNSGEPYQLIDVREIFEHQIDNIDRGEHIPLGRISAAVEQIKTDRSVVFYCRVGERSAEAIRELEEKFGFSNLYNLKGGIRAWSNEIDETIAVV